MAWFILISFLLWRIGLFLIAWWGSTLLPFAPRFPYSDVYLVPSGLPDWLWAFANFDGVHYLTISRYGYAAQFTQVFFPLQPLLLGALYRLMPFISDIVLGIIFASACLLLSLYVLRRLLLLDYPDSTIRWILLFLISFPTSFFFGSLYTEGFFFLLTISSFYCARKNYWVWAGIFGGLAAATRIIGIFLLPALLWEKIVILRGQPKDPDRLLNTNGILRSAQNDLRVILHSPSLYLIPLGLLAYMVYLQLAFGDWLYFWHVQGVFGAQRSGGSIILLPQVIWRYIKIFAEVPWTAEAFWIAVLEFLSTLGCLAALYAAYRMGVRRSYLIFSVLAVLLPTLTGTFSSMPRYILIAFPIFIVLGSIQSSWKKTLALIFSGVLLIILTILFTRGHWVA